MSSPGVIEQRTRLLASVVGFRFHDCTPSVMASGFPIRLQLDPENEIDHSAVKVLVRDVHVGFIAKQDAPAVRRAIVDCDEYTVTVETVFSGSVKVRIEATSTGAATQTNKKRRVDTASQPDSANSHFHSMAADALVYKIESLIELLATVKATYLHNGAAKQRLKSTLEDKFKGADLEDAYDAYKHFDACYAALGVLVG